MRIWTNLSIRKKLAALMLVIIAVMNLGAMALAGLFLNSAQSQSLRIKGASMARLLGETVAGDILNDYLGSMTGVSVGATAKALARVKGDEDVALAAVIVLQGGKRSVAAEFHQEGRAKADPLDLSVPLESGAPSSYSRSGFIVETRAVDVQSVDATKKHYLLIALDQHRTNQGVRRTLAWMFALGVGMVLLGTMAVYFLGSTMAKPLEIMAHRMHDISEGEGDLTARLEVAGNDEIAALARHFNRFMDNIRSIVQQVTAIATSLASGSHEMAGGATEISATAESIAETADGQKASATHADHKVKAIAHSSHAIFTNAKQALDVFERAQTTAQKGMLTVDEAVKGMAQIRDMSGQIGSILSVITEIANQTNLLSLNAAIEAAKAGDQGKGFAVVAEEVRKLAERSGQAATEIAVLIRTSGQSVEEGSTRVNAVGETLRGIQEAIHASGDRIRTIEAESQQQSQDSSSVVQSMNQLLGIAEQNAAATEQMAATLRETKRTVSDLSRAAENLNQLMARFKV